MFSCNFFKCFGPVLGVLWLVGRFCFAGFSFFVAKLEKKKNRAVVSIFKGRLPYTFDVGFENFDVFGFFDLSKDFFPTNRYKPNIFVSS